VKILGGVERVMKLSASILRPGAVFFSAALAVGINRIAEMRSEAKRMAKIGEENSTEKETLHGRANVAAEERFDSAKMDKVVLPPETVAAWKRLYKSVIFEGSWSKMERDTYKRTERDLKAAFGGFGLSIAVVVLLSPVGKVAHEATSAALFGAMGAYWLNSTIAKHKLYNTAANEWKSLEKEVDSALNRGDVTLKSLKRFEQRREDCYKIQNCAWDAAADEQRAILEQIQNWRSKVND
jgi:hypothetical protein